MAKLTNEELKKLALQTRKDIIISLMHAGSGHVGGPMGLADIFTLLYFDYLKHDPKNPDWDKKDYFLLSNGHVAPVWYSVLARTGYFKPEELINLRQLGSPLQGHPWNVKTPGVFNSSGALGQGGSQAIGVALGLKIDNKPNRVFCVLSDGEHDEGQTWEGIMSASKYKLDNLTYIVDLNGIQIEGFTQEIMPVNDNENERSLKQKYEDFGWNAIEVDGHDFDQIRDGLDNAAATKDMPTVLIAKTTPGKGVVEMENKWEFHDWKGDKELAVRALAELSESALN